MLNRDRNAKAASMAICAAPDTSRFKLVVVHNIPGMARGAPPEMMNGSQRWGRMLRIPSKAKARMVVQSAPTSTTRRPPPLA